MKTTHSYIILRLLISVVLLEVAWHHAHWSVALLLTLALADAEMRNYTIGSIIVVVKRIIELEQLTAINRPSWWGKPSARA